MISQHLEIQKAAWEAAATLLDEMEVEKYAL